MFCAKFSLNFSQPNNDFHNYKDGCGKQCAVELNLRHLFNCLDSVLISKAACKRGFS
jgi:hypothetical protein